MEHMIDEYLAFAKGQGGEAVSTVDVRALIDGVVESAVRAGASVDVMSAEGLEANVRPMRSAPLGAAGLRLRQGALRRPGLGAKRQAVRRSRRIHPFVVVDHASTTFVRHPGRAGRMARIPYLNRLMSFGYATEASWLEGPRCS